MAKLVVIAIPVDWGLELEHLALLDLLREAHVVNRNFQVVFVVIDVTNVPDEHASERLRARVFRTPGARLARHSVVIKRRHDYGEGRSVCDAETCDPEIAAALRSLYSEFFYRPVRRVYTGVPHGMQGLLCQRGMLLHH